MNIFGLALSGGGYRAAAFHLGTLRALDSLRDESNSTLLSKVDVMSTISGGSITGAAWALETAGDFPNFEKEMIEKLSTKSVIRFVLTSKTFLLLSLLILCFLATIVYLLLWTSFPWMSYLILALLFFILLKFQFKILPISNVIERAYDTFFFKKRTLIDLPDKPDLAIGSTNLLSTTPFTFSKRKMGDAFFDYSEPPIKFKHESFPISRAVMASSCVPFAFTPITIAKEFYESQEAFKNTDTKLVDGGVFDNQGIHKLTKDKSSWYCPVVVVSDAGNKLPFRQYFPNTIALLIRTVDVFMDRIKDFQIAENIYKRDTSSKEEIAFISLGWDYNKCISGFVDNLIKNQIPQHVVDGHRFHPDWLVHPERFRHDITQHLINRTGYVPREDETYRRAVNIARNVGTNLTKLSKEKIESLALHAELCTTI